MHPATTSGTALTAALDLAEPGTASLVVATDSGQGKIQLSGRLFSSAVSIGSPLRIAIPPEVEEKIPRKYRGQLERWLAEEFACEGSYFAQAGWEKVEDRRPFELLGESWGLGVEVNADGLVATKLRRHKNRRPAILLEAPITLHSIATTPVAAALQGTAEAARQGSPWLSIWMAYQDAEKAVIETLSRKFGSIAYKEWRYVADGRRILFDLQNALPDAWLEEEQPVDLAVMGDKEIPLGRFVGGKSRHGNGKIDQVEVEVEEEVPPETGQLAVALLGTQRRLKRRDRALEHVLKGTGQLPDLGEILVGQGRSSRVGAGLRPETARTLRSLKGRSLNADQRRAIEVALNTPDIALIQGPPGTGKTTVIRLITERLHEEGRSPILLTSFQHEAVLRVLEGVSTAGIPGIRVGGKRGEDPSQSLRPLTDWLRDVATQITATLSGLDHKTPWTVLRYQVDQTVRAWRRAPGGVVGTRVLIQSLQSKLNAVLDYQEQALLERAFASLEQKEVPVLPEELRRELAKLRQQQATTQVAWKDAGPAGCKRLGRSLQREGTTLERLGYRPSRALHELIQRGQALKPFVEAPPDFLEAWGRALEELDEVLQPPPPPPDPEEVPAEAERALQELLAALDARVLREPEGLADVLARFLHRMETDPLALPDILSRYAHAFGATVQQAVGKEMQDFFTDFDTVIVDEAARANPLDLLVALVLGRRLILVGDQNQLPHMLEPRLEAAVLNGQAAEASAVLAESLFSRLWNLYKDCPPRWFCPYSDAERAIPHASADRQLRQRELL